MYLVTIHPPPGMSERLQDPDFAHRALWRLWGDRPDRERDFLFRVEPTGVIALAARPPLAPRGGSVSYVVCQTQWPAGALLCFRLRASAVVTVSRPEGRSKRHDVVEHARRLAGLPAGTESSDELVQSVCGDWLRGRGPRCGFGVVKVRVTARRRHYFAHDGRASVTLYGTDFEGALTVDDPAAFEAALVAGIGPAKGYGFGLMLCESVLSPGLCVGERGVVP